MAAMLSTRARVWAHGRRLLKTTLVLSVLASGCGGDSHTAGTGGAGGHAISSGGGIGAGGTAPGGRPGGTGGGALAGSGGGEFGGAAGRATGGAAGAADNFGLGTAFPLGIGSESTWSSGVVAHLTGPYAPCGVLGNGTIVFGAANPKAAEIAAASRAGIVRFFSTDTGQETRAPLYAGAPVSGVDYSRDATQLVLATDAGLQIVRLADQKVIFTNQPFASYARAAALSPDGSLIAAVGWDVPPLQVPETLYLRLVRVSDGELLAEFPVTPDDVRGVPPQFSDDGTLLVTANQMFSVPSLQVRPPLGYFGPLALSPDGSKVAQQGHVVDVASGNELKTPSADQSNSYLWSGFSPDGATYAEAYDEAMGVSIHLYRVSNWAPIGTSTAIAFMGTLGADLADGRMFFTRDGTALVAALGRAAFTVTDGPAFQIMNVPALTPGATIAAPPFTYGALALSPDGSLVAAGNAVWRTADQSLVSALAGLDGNYRAFLANGDLQDWFSYTLVDPRTGAQLGHALGEFASPDGTLGLFPTTYPKTAVVRLADLTTQSVLDTTGLISPGTPGWAFSRDNRFVAVAQSAARADAQTTVFDVKTGAPLMTVAGGAPLALETTSTGAARLAAFIPVTNTFPTDLRVWSVPDGTPLFDVPQVVPQNDAPGSYAPSMAFSPDGSLLAVGGDGIRIIQASTGTVRQTLPAHTDPLSTDYKGASSVAFSPSGQIVSDGFDGTMRFWCSP